MLITSMKGIATLAAAATLGLLFSQTGSATQLADSATVYMVSQPGNYIGSALGAPQVEWVHGVDGIFSASNYGSFNHAIDVTYNNGNIWDFEFAAPTYNPATNTNDGQYLHDGLYTNTERFPFNSPTLPGMTISGNGAGDNQDSGWFDILNIAYNPDGTLKSLAVDFEQYDRPNEAGPGLYGSLRYNSSIPIDPVPLPDTLGLLLGGCLCALLLVNPKWSWRTQI